MSDISEIKQEARADMTLAEETFNAITKRMDEVANEYNKQIKEHDEAVIKLNEEGRKELERLDQQRQLQRGVYLQALKIYDKEAYTKLVEQQAQQQAEAQAQQRDGQVEVQENYETEDTSMEAELPDVKVEEVKESTLTQDEVEAVKEVVKTTNKKDEIKQGYEVPDYLKG